MRVERIPACPVAFCPAKSDPDWHQCWCGAKKIEHHHVESRGMGGSKIKGNVVALCHDHHEAVTLHDCYDLVTDFDWGKTYSYIDTNGEVLHTRTLGEAGSAAAEGACSSKEERLIDNQEYVGSNPTRPLNSAAAPPASPLSPAAETVEQAGALTPRKTTLPSDVLPVQNSGLSAAEPSLALPGTITSEPTQEADATYGATSLRLWEGMGYERWTEVGGWLRRMTDSVGWWWGDWVNFGEQKYGEKYSQAIDESGLSYSTLANMGSVSREFECSRRRDILPWGHHAEVAGLEREDQERLLDKAAAEGLKQAQIRRQVLLVRDAERIKTLPAIAGTFTTIVADPPWPYQDTATRGAAEDHYDTMEIDAICNLEVSGRPVRELAPAHGAHLYLWVPGMHLREGWALQVVRAWGFEPATMLTWVKPQMGIGRWFRSASEYVLFCTRDGLPLTVQDRAFRNWFEADRTKHSQKPTAFYELVQTVSPGPYLDLFGRTKREGWEVWGDEA